MPNDDERVQSFKILWRDLPDCPIALDEGVPHGVKLAAERYLCPEKYRQVIGQIARTAVVEIEEGRKARLDDARVEAVAIAVAVSCCQIEGFDGLNCSRGKSLEVGDRVLVLD